MGGQVVVQASNSTSRIRKIRWLSPDAMPAGHLRIKGGSGVSTRIVGEMETFDIALRPTTEPRVHPWTLVI